MRNAEGGPRWSSLPWWNSGASTGRSALHGARMLTTVENAAEKSKVQFFQQFLHGQPMMGCDPFKNATEGSSFDWLMAGHHLMVLTVLLAGDGMWEPFCRSTT